MKNKVIKLRTCILFCILSVFFTVTLMASPTMEKITAYINYGINIVIDGETVELHDANGDRIYPISYEGTTYLPIRGVAESLDFKVDWDGKTGSVVIDTSYESRESLIIDTAKSTTNSKILKSVEERTLKINDEDYIADNGMICNLVSNQDFQAKDYLSLSVKDKYKSVSFDCLSPVNCSVNIFNQSGKLVRTFYIKPNNLTRCNFALTNKDTSLVYFVCVNQTEVLTEDYVYLLNLYGELK